MLIVRIRMSVLQSNVVLHMQCEPTKACHQGIATMTEREWDRATSRVRGLGLSNNLMRQRLNIR